jgi:hypothetical protein
MFDHWRLACGGKFAEGFIITLNSNPLSSTIWVLLAINGAVSLSHVFDKGFTNAHARRHLPIFANVTADSTHPLPLFYRHHVF